MNPHRVTCAQRERVGKAVRVARRVLQRETGHVEETRPVVLHVNPLIVEGRTVEAHVRDGDAVRRRVGSLLHEVAVGIVEVRGVTVVVPDARAATPVEVGGRVGAASAVESHRVVGREVEATGEGVGVASLVLDDPTGHVHAVGADVLEIDPLVGSVNGRDDNILERPRDIPNQCAGVVVEGCRVAVVVPLEHRRAPVEVAVGCCVRAAPGVDPDGAARSQREVIGERVGVAVGVPKRPAGHVLIGGPGVRHVYVFVVEGRVGVLVDGAELDDRLVGAAARTTAVGAPQREVRRIQVRRLEELTVTDVVGVVPNVVVVEPEVGPNARREVVEGGPLAGRFASGAHQDDRAAVTDEGVHFVYLRTGPRVGTAGSDERPRLRQTVAS